MLKALEDTTAAAALEMARKSTQASATRVSDSADDKTCLQLSDFEKHMQK